MLWGSELNLEDFYKKRIIELAAQLREQKRPILLFGAGRASWYVLQVLGHLEIDIAGIMDNNPDRQGTFHKCAVSSVETMAAAFPDAVVLIGVFMPRTAETISDQLKQYHLLDSRYMMAEFLYFYFMEVASRKCDTTLFAESIKTLFEYYESSPFPNASGFNKHISPSVTGYITLHCTLSCRDCGSLIPYYRNPVHIDPDSVVEDIRRFAAAFDLVPEVSLSGGEPFLHPKFHEICLEISRIPNIVFINFTTNGTLIPSEEQLRTLSSCGADIHQSDYGNLSTNQETLFKRFAYHSIYCDINYVNQSHKWFPRPEYMKKNRTGDENDEIFRKCVKSNCFCLQIMGGELHRCPFSLNGMHQQKLGKFPEDYVNLNAEAYDSGSIAGKIRSLAFRERALSACDYCHLWESEFVDPAIQIPRSRETHLVKRQS